MFDYLKGQQNADGSWTSGYIGPVFSTVRQPDHPATGQGHPADLPAVSASAARTAAPELEQQGRLTPAARQDGPSCTTR